ncbi:MAG TPA: DNA-3-methyladenine glycosylase [Gammaproteobacteria bacterium]|nr:DNA-3-methyladenine glycosylase [Gammaproteobacteria bacterium]
MTILDAAFFDRDACIVAKDLLGKVLRRRWQDRWLACRIIETEAYYRREKASHSSLGYTEKRKAMFMPPGTIYMYDARGGDSLNVSVRGVGNAVLIKAGVPWFDDLSPQANLHIMQRLNPIRGSGRLRPAERLCAGQTLLCRSLGLKVKDWDQRPFDPQAFRVEDVGHPVHEIIQTTRLGIPPGRDGHLMYRFIDQSAARHATRNPLTRRGAIEGRDYRIVRRRG